MARLIDTPSDANGWDGPGWYFQDDEGYYHGPFATKVEADRAEGFYGTGLDLSWLVEAIWALAVGTVVAVLALLIAAWWPR